jgi:hypothetical protein
MLLQNRDALCDALITHMCRCARYKPSDVIGLAAAKTNVFVQSQPRRHRRLLSDDDPRPLATLAQQHVELGAAHGDGAPVG